MSKLSTGIETGSTVREAIRSVIDLAAAVDSTVARALRPADPAAPPFPQLYLAAMEVGIARNALADAIAFARSRPAADSGAQPYAHLAVGEISARVHAAEAVVLSAATAVDTAHEGGGRADLLAAASVQVAQARFLAAEAAQQAAELVFAVGGGSAAARGRDLDRHRRNARAVAAHDPGRWEIGAVGAYRLTGAPPPTSGLF